MRHRIFSWALVAGALGGTLLAGLRGMGETESLPPEEAYVGQSVCMSCHKEVGEEWLMIRHSSTLMREEPSPLGQRGCEACHGPGLDHAKEPPPGERRPQIPNPARMSPAERSDVCLQCHQSRVPRDLWTAGPHAANPDAPLSCTTCHDVHRLTRSEPMLVASEQEVCLERCHREKGLAERISREEHHRIESWADYPDVRIEKGFLSCIRCHNPHGSANLHLLVEPPDVRLCEKCHQKGGPQPSSHRALDWPERHGLVAKDDKGPCLQCHREDTFCTACHGTTMPHPDRWVTDLHKAEASFSEDASCFKCHARQWCGICHTRG